MTMHSREEFEQKRAEWVRDMTLDPNLKRESLDLLVKADHYNWIHQTTWFGEPILQLPQDMFVLQEIIFRTRPKYIIEVGVAWAGSLLYYATLMNALGGERIIGIDIYIPDDLKARIRAFGPLTERIELIEASSIESSTLERLRGILGDCRQTLIHLDSNHTHEHVLKELELYAHLVGPGYYMICGDTIVEEIPPQTHRPRPWGPGNNPKTALNEFLKGSDSFKVDRQFQNRYLFTCNPDGYLLRTKEDGPGKIL